MLFGLCPCFFLALLVLFLALSVLSFGTFQALTFQVELRHIGVTGS
jgi:hypothetical protein